jgi:hypothetical protein
MMIFSTPKHGAQGGILSFRPEVPDIHADAGQRVSEGDAMAETWDELASGLSAAPESSRSAIERSTSADQEVTFLAVDEDPIHASGTVTERGSGPAVVAVETAFPATGQELTAEQMDRIASRVVERLSDRVVREIAWEIIPEIAETLIRQRIRELEEKIAREG